MDSIQGLLDGFAVAIDPMNILFVLLGTAIGMVIGILPGLGPTATIALLLPLTFGLDATTAIIMLAGIYYGSMYGGTITSVLLALPGEASSVITVIDGHRMAKQGRAGAALGIAAIGSAIGGFLAAIGLALFAPPLAAVALKMGPPEFTLVAVIGLMLAAYLGTKSFTKSIAVVAIGLLLATIGQDPISGATRFAFGNVDLIGGLDFAAMAMGLFGVGEILYSLYNKEEGVSTTKRVGRALPTRREMRQSMPAIGRGGVLGFILGVLPGGGGMVPPLASYAVEKRISKNRANFGKGAIEGVAGPETANNAGSQAAFVPLLTLGIPANGVLALLFGALLIQGVTPGPQLITQHPAIFWGVIASMFIGNIILLILNIPLIGLFVKILKVPFDVLGPIAALVTLIGAFTINNNPFDMFVVLVFGVIGFFMRKGGFEAAPLVLAFVLGVIIERSMRQSLLLSQGSFDIFVTRPGSGAMVLIIVAILTTVVFQAIRTRKNSAGGSSAVALVAAQAESGIDLSSETVTDAKASEEGEAR